MAEIDRKQALRELESIERRLNRLGDRIRQQEPPFFESKEESIGNE